MLVAVVAEVVPAHGRALGIVGSKPAHPATGIPPRIYLVTPTTTYRLLPPHRRREHRLDRFCGGPLGMPPGSC